MRDYLSRNVVGVYVTDGDGIATAADIADHLGETLLDDPPPAPQVTGSIADRSYTVGGGPYTIDLDTKFSGATSYQVTPQPAGVSLSGAILTITPAEPVAKTTITVHGVAHGRQSEPITFALTIEAAAPVVTVPGAPSLSLMSGLTTSTSLTWAFTDPVDTGGAAITARQVEVRLASDDSLVDTLTGAPFTATDLTASTTYYGVPFAQNSEGWSDPGTAEPGTTGAAQATAPDAPVLSLVSKTDTTITVSWPAPDDGGSAITSYRLYIGGDLAINNAASPQQIIKLNPDTQYSITVEAVNAVDASEKSEPLVVTTDVTDVPGPDPAPITMMTSVTKDGITVSFYDAAEGGNLVQQLIVYDALGDFAIITDENEGFVECWFEVDPPSQQDGGGDNFWMHGLVNRPFMPEDGR